jgi:hypothetical protein
MKQMVRCELELDHYRVIEEPLFPPTSRISWAAYRPDLLAFRSDLRMEEIAVVECETHPSMTRFTSKNYSSLWFEPSILHDGSIRRILAVPRGKLNRVDLRLRQKWEIWVLGSTRPLEKIPAIA